MTLNMKENIEFQDIGKNIPYKAPDSFFDQISEKTLYKAKLREQAQRRNLTLWKTFTGAAALAAVVLLGYLIYDPAKQVQKPAVQQNHSLGQQMIQKPDLLNEPTHAIRKKDSSAKIIPEVKKTEDVMDVLTDLSDEELMQLAAMYNSDTFIGESLN